MRLKNPLALAGLVAALGALAGPTAVSAAETAPGGPTVKVIAKGLDAPKYMSFGPGGLYVAESGSGGHRCTDLVGITGAPTEACAGASGAVERIDGKGNLHPVVSGLASVEERDVGEIEGPIAVTFSGGRPVVLNRGAFVNQAGRSSIPGRLGKQFGTLAVASPGKGSRLRTLADLPAFAAHDPQPGAMLGGVPGELTYDSDAHDVVPYRGGYAIADAGANDVLWLSPARKLSLIARLPTVPEKAPAGAFGKGSPAQEIQSQAVPSSVAVGPEGSLYVGTLSGLPGLPGSSSVYRVAAGKSPTQVVAGLTRVDDIAFEPGGGLLILEADVRGTLSPPTTPGALLRAHLTPGKVVRASRLPVEGLVQPTGLAIAPDGDVYISNDTDVPGKGEILRLSTR